ncbi:MAG: amidohydrolase family protein [Chitinispirillales bacterium]|nr:amidohydrolase family protein [Chitinispirillales bacterium]
MDNGEILLNGAVSVRNGIIEDAGPRGKIKRVRDERIVNLGDMLLLPGFINMHTHLEEGPIRGFTKDGGESFTAWNNKRYSRMRQLTEEQICKSIKLSAREHVSQGTTTIVDFSRTGFSASVLADEPVRAVIIKDVVYERFLEHGIAQIESWSGEKNALKYGIAPHALYSLSVRGHRRLIEHGYKNERLWACHLAESSEELQAFCEHSGDFFFSLTRNRPWLAGDEKIGSVHYALRHNLIPSYGILIHCNYINSYELALLAAKRAFVTLCFRYSKEMGHKSFPLEAANRRGVQICLGTEGMMPPGELSLFDELFHLKQAYPHISASEMIRWVTKNPAAALRVSDKLGSISPGKYADIIGARFPYRDGDDILETLLMSDPDVAFVLIDGKEVIVS